MLVDLLSQIEQLKQMSGEASLAAQVGFALEELSKFFEENCVNFPEKRWYLAEAKYRFVFECFDWCVAHRQQAAKLHADLESQASAQLQKQMAEAREESRQELQKLE